jgi:mgtE-like transporter
MFKETAKTCLFDLGGLVAGFLIAWQLGIFQLAPWVIALYPAVLSVKGVISGLLTSRLSTALHLGTVYPRFFGNTKSFYKLIQAMTVLTLGTSITISVIAIFFGTLLWGISFGDFPAILSVILATMSLGLLTTLVTVKVAFISFKRGLDPDTVVYPACATLAEIVITFFYIAVINLFFWSILGKIAIILLGLINVILVLVILPLNLREKYFSGILKESVGTMFLVAFIVNVTGTFLVGVNSLANARREIFTAYPAMMDMIGDVGLVVGAAATTKLALGVLAPSFSSIKKHTKSIVSAWAASLVLFMVLGLLSLVINGVFSLQATSNLLLLLLISNVIAFIVISVFSQGLAILTFKRGLDPDNFVIPLGSALADAVTTIALFAALLILV